MVSTEIGNEMKSQRGGEMQQEERVAGRGSQR